MQVDAFTDRPFSGNPAAVCMLDRPRPDRWLAAVAGEMNLSETAFLRAAADGWALRWFTPRSEVELCGHATLASAHVLWTEGQLAESEPARFQTLSGLLTARRAGSWIEMDFPAEVPAAVQPPESLLRALGLGAAGKRAREGASVRWCGRNRFDYLVEVASADAVRSLEPTMEGLAGLGARGVIVTAASDDDAHDFVSRFFAPGLGVSEDPVTGSAHCALAPYWAARLGRKRLTGYQASERGGTVKAEWRGERVLLAGQAVTVLRGTLLH